MSPTFLPAWPDWQISSLKIGYLPQNEGGKLANFLTYNWLPSLWIERMELFSLSKFFPHHTDKISSADLQDFLNFPSQPKFPQSEGHLPPSGARTLVRFMLPCCPRPVYI